jgi:hypothetical protein
MRIWRALRCWIPPPPSRAACRRPVSPACPDMGLRERSRLGGGRLLPAIFDRPARRALRLDARGDSERTHRGPALAQRTMGCRFKAPVQQALAMVLRPWILSGSDPTHAAYAEWLRPHPWAPAVPGNRHRGDHPIQLHLLVATASLRPRVRNGEELSQLHKIGIGDDELRRACDRATNWKTFES